MQCSGTAAAQEDARQCSRAAGWARGRDAGPWGRAGPGAGAQCAGLRRLSEAAPSPRRSLACPRGTLRARHAAHRRHTQHAAGACRGGRPRRPQLTPAQAVLSTRSRAKKKGEERTLLRGGGRMQSSPERGGGSGTQKSKTLCTKNSPNQYFLLENFIVSHCEIRSEASIWAGRSVHIRLWLRLPRNCHRLLSIVPMYGASAERSASCSSLDPASAVRRGGGMLAPPPPRLSRGTGISIVLSTDGTGMGRAVEGDTARTVRAPRVLLNNSASLGVGA